MNELHLCSRVQNESNQRHIFYYLPVKDHLNFKKKITDLDFVPLLQS